jgi:type IV secretory pathway component VirB8
LSLFNIFKIKRNNKFRYSPRYSMVNSSNQYGFNSVYIKNRESNSVFDKSNSWDEARLRSRNRSNRLFSKTIIFIVILLTLLFLYVIDFDLSIFYK